MAERDSWHGGADAPGQQGELRAADADRAQVADRLRVALDEGRLSLTEYDERLQQAYAAKTYGELEQLVIDLPAPAPAGHARMVPHQSADPRTTGQAERAAADRTGGGVIGRWLAGVWGAWLIAVLINVVVWASVSIGTGDPVYPWPLWVAGPWGAVLLAITISGLVGHPGRDRRSRRKRRSRRRG